MPEGKERGAAQKISESGEGVLTPKHPLATFLDD